MFLNNNFAAIESVLKSFIFVLQIILFPVAAYYFIVSMFGWFKRKDDNADNYKPIKRFAMIVAAHNEEQVIGSIVRNLKSVDYPQEMYDIFVIADNCSDNTAKIATESGAQAFERFDDYKKGKGFALEWMFDKIFKMEKKYDAVCVFDADNLVSLNFLKEMNKHLCKGHQVIQGYLDSKNPLDSLISGSYSITYWMNNRLFQLARYYLGLSAAIGGTGFVVATEVLKEIGWGATCLTEDLEFTIKLILKGKKAFWAHNAIVYDEKPLTMAQSWRQRKRWMQGQADCACRYFVDLMTKAVKKRDWVAFDCALYVIYPAIMVISGFGMILNIIRFLLFTNPSELITMDFVLSAVSLLVFTYYGLIFIVLEGKLSLKVLGYFLLFPIYSLTWLPIIIQGYIDRDKKEWVHTLHTRALDIKDMGKLGKAG
ncbi:MAG: Beta-monoglucosyldiacylglycerol synthase [Firmicutes bacterium ADurb.Bin419]|nr:MAG: Beta-monoglucosyldiacylglycerol synthase [Firmicutes bacterium ADurb.Bin419]